MLNAAAMVLCGDEFAARELVTLLLGDLFGTTVDREGKRRSKLAFYTGRGSLAGWLRATLAQACVEQHRLHRRFISIDEALPFLAGQSAAPDANVHVDPRVGPAIELAIGGLAPESRLLIKAHYLDQMTLSEIARLMGTHESTISRRLSKVTRQLRRSILQSLVAKGMSISAARLALASDVRYVSADIEGALVRVV
jgi:RNA polymerase sigma-70 factor (ECF subfamily)